MPEGQEKRFEKQVGSLLIIGTPDLIYGGAVYELKTTEGWSGPDEHHRMQLRMYLWLTGLPMWLGECGTCDAKPECPRWNKK